MGALLRFNGFYPLSFISNKISRELSLDKSKQKHKYMDRANFCELFADNVKTFRLTKTMAIEYGGDLTF